MGTWVPGYLLPCLFLGLVQWFLTEGTCTPWGGIREEPYQDTHDDLGIKTFT